MTFSGLRNVTMPQQIWYCFVIILLIAGQPLLAPTADAAPEIFQGILSDSLADIWAGREFNPSLKKRQQTLKTMLATGEVNQAGLESMMEATISSLMDRRKTSRYIIKAMPERVTALFSPHMNWESFYEIMWRALSSAIKKEDPIVMTVGTLAPPGTPWLSVPEKTGFPKIERLSAGKVLTKIYGGGVMGEDTDILKKMNAGQLDTCGCTALGVLEACPEASALLLPGLFNNYAEVDYICEKFRKRLDDAFEKRGYTLLALIDTGYFYIFARNKTTGLDDLRKNKVITWFGAIERALYEELGITPRPVAVPDTVSALSTGLADTNVAPAAWMLGMQTYQYANYYLKPPLVYSPGAVIVSGHLIDRIQEQTGMSVVYAHNLLEANIYEWNTLEPEWKRQIRSYEEKSLKAFETKCGIKPVTFSFEDQQTLKKASAAVLQKLTGKVFPPDLTEDIQKALEAYRSTN